MDVKTDRYGDFTNEEYSGIAMQYIYDSISVDGEIDTVFFQLQGSATVYNQVVTDGTMADTILCHTNLGLSEITTTIDAQLYPNPFTNTTKMLLKGLSPEKTEVTCTDVLGRTIPFKYIVSGDHEIQIQLEESITGLVVFHLKNGKHEGVIRGMIE